MKEWAKNIPEKQNIPVKTSNTVMAQFNLQHLTTEQAHIYHVGIKKIDDDRHGFCFLDARAGSGKTILIETLLASQRAQGKIDIATPSRGLAASLLSGGKTLHSTFIQSITEHHLIRRCRYARFKKVQLCHEYFKKQLS